MDIGGLLDSIELFKEELRKRDAFTPGEKLEILKIYCMNIFNVHEAQFRLEKDVQVKERSATHKTVFSKYQSFAELVRLTKFKQHPDLILLAAYYLNVIKNVNSVTTVDIEQEYSSAMLKASTNTNANINVNRGKGFMMEGEKREGKKTFKITMSGVEYIEEILAEAKNSKNG